MTPGNASLKAIKTLQLAADASLIQGGLDELEMLTGGPRKRRCRRRVEFVPRSCVESLESRTLLSAYAFHAIASFGGLSGPSLNAGVTLDSHGNLFGTTVNGGANSDGTIYEIASGSTTITTFATFNGTNGSSPNSGVTVDSSGDLFGTTSGNGANGAGTVYEVAHGTTSITTIASFNISSNNGTGSGVILDSSGDLFGTDQVFGNVYEIPRGAHSFTNLANATVSTGFGPNPGLTLDSSGDLFGTASNSDTNSSFFGTVFEIVKGSGTATTVATFDGVNGNTLNAGLAIDSGSDLFGTISNFNDGVSGASAFEIPAGTTSVNYFASFNNTNGAYPSGALIADSSGDVFGTTTGGGVGGDGTVYETPTNTTTINTLASFNGVNGISPASPLALDSSGDLFGQTYQGGANGQGVIFALVPASHTAFTQPSLNTIAGNNLGGAGGVLVSVEDASGTVATSDEAGVTLTISGGIFSNGQSTATAPAVNGVATFNNLSVTAAGNYTLTATQDALTGHVSFTVAPGPVSLSQSTVSTNVGGITVGNAATITLQAKDAFGNNLTSGGLDVAFGLVGSDVGSIGPVADNGNGAYTATFTGTAPGDASVSATINSLLVSSAAAPITVSSAAVILSAAIFAPDATSIGSTSETVTVIYTDSQAQVDPTTLAASNITVNTPGGAMLPITLGSETQGGNAVEVTYVVTAPNGAFATTDVGTYTVSVIGGAVKDKNGNAVAASTGTFLFLPVEDPNFGQLVTGTTTPTGHIGLSFAGQDVTQEPDGSILIAGFQSTGAGSAQGVLEQLTPDGVIDTTFGSNGLVVTPAGDDDQFYSAAVQSDGKIVAVGGSSGSFLVARYNSDGSLDAGFGAGGFATAGFGADGAATAYTVAIQSNGSIVVAGGTNSGLLAVARFTPAGALDSTFNAGGVDDSTFPAGGQRTIAAGGTGAISQILVDAQNRIVGVAADGATVAAFRLDSDGSNDPTFGAGGIANLSQLASQDSSSVANTENLALQPSGDILICGQAAGGGFGAVRLTSFGQVDATFASNGLLTTSFGGADEAADSVTVNPTTGQFMLIGATTLNNVVETGIAAFNPDGSADTTFGNAGQITLPSAAPATGAGSNSAQTRAFHPQNLDFAYATLQANGQLIVGAGNPVQSVFRRLKVTGIDGITPVSIGGTPRTRLAPFKLPNGTTVTITLQGGSGTVSEDGNDVALDLTAGTPAVTIHTRGGANTLTLSSMTVSGSLRSLMAPTAQMAGTLSIAGASGAIRLANLTGALHSGGNIASLTIGSVSGSVSCGNLLGQAKFGLVTGIIAALDIHSFSAAGLSGAMILAGAKLGSPATLGIAAVPATYGAGQILSFTVTGSVTSSFIEAGAMPPTGGALDGGSDTLAGPGSAIKSMFIRGGVDASTRFESGVFPRFVRIPKSVKPADDSLHRFVMLDLA